MNKSVAFVFLGLLAIVAMVNADGHSTTVEGVSSALAPLLLTTESEKCYRCSPPCNHGYCCLGTHPQCCTTGGSAGCGWCSQ